MDTQRLEHDGSTEPLTADDDVSAVGESTDVPSPTSDEPSALDLVLERLARVEAHLTQFDRRSAHREAVIDRLHEENEELRAGVSRAVLEPAVADLVRLHDGLVREAARLEGRPPDPDPSRVLDGFADEVELILDRCGVELFSAKPGAPYQPGEHRPLAVVPTDDPEQHNTVAEVIAVGFRQRDTGRVRRPVQARFHQYRQPGEA